MNFIWFEDLYTLPLRASKTLAVPANLQSTSRMTRALIRNIGEDKKNSTKKEVIHPRLDDTGNEEPQSYWSVLHTGR